MTSPAKAIIIGDSISIGYMPHVERLGAGRYAAVHNDDNAGDSENVRRNLTAWLAAAGEVELVHFNCGLHDIKTQRGGNERQVSIDHFRANLAAIVDTLRATGKKLIWATITPVIYERHLTKGFDRRQSDVEAYNAVALEVISPTGIAVDDLHAAVQATGVEQCLAADGVHMTEQAYVMLAQRVAGAVAAGLVE